MVDNGAQGVMRAIAYRDFYDVPRIFVVRRDGEVLIFDGLFDDGLDDYPDVYAVRRAAGAGAKLASVLAAACANRAIGESIGSIPVIDVEFDPTKRRSITEETLDRIVRR